MGRRTFRKHRGPSRQNKRVANVHAAWLSQLNPLAIAGNVLFPVIYRVTKMLAADHPVTAADLVKALEPRTLAGDIGGSLVGGAVGAVVGAATQSALAGFG